MKGLRISEIGKLELIEMDVPAVPANHVLLKVNSISICGTDIHEWEGKVPITLPRIPGHDFSGTIVEGGKGVHGFEAGQRVVVKPSFPCYACPACQAGSFENCPDTRLIGLNSDGCFREFMAVPAANLIPLPDHVSFEAASILEPFTVGLNAFEKLGLDLTKSFGGSVTILGQGPIGLGVTRIAAIAGVEVICAVDVRDNVLKLARQFGAAYTVNTSGQNALETILHATGGPTDIVIETAGASANIGILPALVKKGGRIVNIGIFKGIGSIPVEAIVAKGLTIIGIGGNGGKGKYEAVLRLTGGGVLEPARLITHRFPFSEALEAFEVARDKSKNSIKVVVTND
jgi:2-desacetyl-2-hydroxyethyl bacteriochlorophyllide A dehydrogenase